uniref:Uncharacterized protein n=1 Tax=Oryza sativa subsp. japonica TaxID=39947 RepID=Q67U38_ORYSJ|nr:hypothetical protein [Oryza sativa Japonica Group]BAD38333.1 hypothetical protein [Oryza sativa Japonica Group]
MGLLFERKPKSSPQAHLVRIQRTGQRFVTLRVSSFFRDLWAPYAAPHPNAVMTLGVFTHFCKMFVEAGQRVGTGEKAGGRRVCWRSATGDAAAVTAATTSSAAGRGGG